MVKKILVTFLALIMALSFVACGDNNTEEDAAADIVLAMITDSGDITDQSFNQTTYEACGEWADENAVDFTYYKPENDSDEARIASIEQAIADGANVIVIPGYLFAAAIVEVADTYPDVKLVGLDIGEGDLIDSGSEDGNVWDNVFCATYQEELAGYMAGYAVVKMGYSHLGFLGGMSVPAVTRFGYGYVQGANDAAVELGIESDVAVEYVCGGQFYGDADITAYMDTWYSSNGVEIVFACGGGIYTSAAEAAARVDGKVIGVDSDQSGPIDSEYGEGITITSAMKGLGATVKSVLTDIVEGNWDEYGGQIENLGLVSADDPELNYVQIPLETTLWTDDFTQDDYIALVAALFNGDIEVSNDITEMPATTITVNDYGSIK